MRRQRPGPNFLSSFWRAENQASRELHIHLSFSNNSVQFLDAFSHAALGEESDHSHEIVDAGLIVVRNQLNAELLMKKLHPFHSVLLNQQFRITHPDENHALLTSVEFHYATGYRTH